MTRHDELAANRRLAELLGWTSIVELGGALLGCPPAGQPQCRGQARVPDWCGDWRETAPLVLRHRILVAPLVAGACIGGKWLPRDRGADEERVARAVIVAVVTAKLQRSSQTGEEVKRGC